MGKTNKANRTKGNTRPSSSGHSAQLLGSSGKSFSGFIGFDALEKDIPSYIPVTGQHSADAYDMSVDSDLRMVMRKMLKRDTVTRLKAVQEFGDLCAGKDKDIVKNVLPFWPRLFNKLALDYDRRIREATHQANGKLISNVKREIAPYLKNIMGVWLLGQSDLHAPAASAAQATFIDAFPKSKQSEALMYCKNEIFSYFKDNLLEQTAKSLSENNPATPEDIENKYILVISATLQAMKLFLATISQNEIANVRDDYLSIVSENKFWKYAKNKEAQIRGSWYALISFLCHVSPDIFTEMEKKLAAAVFGSLSESHPVVAPHVWESALHIVVSFDNCWQGISIHKVVLPQLWALLNEGGRGSAHVLYPCILPFLSKFPKEVIFKETFLSQFFTCLRHSLILECVKLSSMECDAVLSTFIECLQYISFNMLNKTKDGPALLEKMMSDHILPLVEVSFYDNRFCHLATSKFYPLLGSLIQMIENKHLSESEEMCKLYSQILVLFWNGICNIFNKFFYKKQKENMKVSVYITYFFHCIFSTSHAIMKSEKNKVRFEDEEEKEKDMPHISSDILPSVETYKKMPITFTQIIKFIKILCCKNNESLDIYNVKILDEIIASTLSPEFLIDILKSFEDSDCCEMTAMVFFDHLILKWVSCADFNKPVIDCIGEIIFSLCSSVPQHEALEILNTCCKVKNSVLVESMLNKGLKMYAHESVIQNWLKSTDLIDYIINGAKNVMECLIHDDVKNNEADVLAQKNILLTCLVSKDFQEILRESHNIEKILMICEEYIVQGLKCKNSDCLFEVTCTVIETVLINYEVCWNYAVTDELLSLLFNWNLNSEEYGLSEKTCVVLSKCWQTAIFSSCKSSTEITRKNSFILRAAKDLNIGLSNCSSEQAKKTLNEILNLLHTVEAALSSIQNNYSSAFVLSELLENILPSELQWKIFKDGLVLSLMPSFLNRKILYPLPKEEHVMIPLEILSNLFVANKVILQVFLSEIEHNNSSESEQYFEQYIIKHMPNLLWCVSYLKGNGYMNQDFDTNFFAVNVLEEYCMKILQIFPYEKVQNLLKNIFDQSLCEGINWVFAFELFLEMAKLLQPEYAAALVTNLLSDAFLAKSNHASLMVQILSHHISREKKVFYLRNLLCAFIDERDGSYNVITYDNLSKIAEICCFAKDLGSFDDEMKVFLSDFINIILCYDCEKSSQFLFSLQISSLISSVVQFMPDIVTKKIWSYLQMLLTSSIEDCKSLKLNRPQDFILLFQASSLYSTSFSFIHSNNKIDKNWNPSVSDELNKEFIFLFIHTGGVIKQFKPLLQAFGSALNELLNAVKYIPDKVLYKCVMESPANSKKSTISSKEGKALETPFESLLRILSESDIQYLQLAAHLMLMKIMPLLSESLLNVCKSDADDSEDEDEKVPSKLLPLVGVLSLLNELMETMLWDFKIGDCCLVMPNTVAYAFVSAYLLAWLQMLEFISSSPSQVRSGYVAHLEETKLLSSFFSNVYRLMPENPMSCLKKGLTSETPKKENFISLFLYAPKVSAENPSVEEIQILACCVFCTAMRRVPASIRTWFNNLDKKSADIVNRFTSKYISGILCAEEIQAVQNNENLFKNMMVKARLGSREVIATYTVDEFTIELCVQLPTNYPLSPVIAEKRGKIVISQQEVRHWLMQLTTVLSYQNGSILDGLNIWQKNLDKKFEGVEECMICYYILHNSSLKLPKLSCHVCKKKFHHACLYKWFNSSNNFTCPLCRNEFVI